MSTYVGGPMYYIENTVSERTGNGSAAYSRSSAYSQYSIQVMLHWVNTITTSIDTALTSFNVMGEKGIKHST